MSATGDQHVGNTRGRGGADVRVAPSSPVLARIAIDLVISALALTTAVFVAGSTQPTGVWPAAGIVLGSVLFVAGLFAAGAYLSFRGLTSLSAARIILGIAGAAAVLALAGAIGAPTGLGGIEIVCGAALAICIAFVVRLLPPRRRMRNLADGKARTLIVGSRDAALAVIRLIDSQPDLPHRVIGCVDDYPEAHDVDGVPVIGAIADLPRLIGARRITSVVVAAPTGENGLVKRVQTECAKAAGPVPKVRVIPNLDDLLRGKLRTSRMRDVRLEDLLRREPIVPDLSQVGDHIDGRVVLVTGAGGSIGGELCRQIVTFRPKLLLLLGHGENSLFAIERELRADHPECVTKIVLADVADGQRVSTIFGHYRPHVVFHAAAHKHVPILETNVCEAVRNNVFGTNAVALAAAASGVAKFVMISTDKAVNPTSVMGATKRLAEMICQSFERRTGTEFVSVRFGNVLGSRGSVLDVFTRQIDAGGPLTITHPDMERFFMSIPEAVALVLEAMAIGRDGQVFVMDMGKPVSVIELAENLVSLAGLRPYEDIDIVFTGVRPGEKLSEELLTIGEGANPSMHQRLFVAQQERIEYDRMVERIASLRKAMTTSDAGAVVQCLTSLVPTFQPGPHLIDKRADGAETEQPEMADDTAVVMPADRIVTGTIGAAAASENGAMNKRSTEAAHAAQDNIADAI